MIRESVLLEQEKQKAKLALDQQKDKTNSNKVKSLVKRKSNFSNCSSRENNKKREKLMHDIFGEAEKGQLKKDKKKEERKKCIITSKDEKKRIFKTRG